MRKEEFAELLGDINEKHIVEAGAERKARKPAWVTWGTMAACLCLALAGFQQMKAGDSSAPAAGSGADGVMPGGVWMETEDLVDRDSGSCQEGVKVPLPEEAQDPVPEDAPGTAADAPVQTATELAGSEDGLHGLWGGSYLDENGNCVIWLTENTAENQKAVFERNPSLSEDSTVFKTADFTLDYLTELLKSISEGMRDGTLPYVISAGVMEQINRVSVTMTTDDGEAMAAAAALDALGGAIEFHYASGNSKEELIAEDEGR